MSGLTVGPGGFTIEWGQTESTGWVTMTVPREFLQHFSSPGDIMMQFLLALQARGVDVDGTDELRTRIQAGGARISWKGDVSGSMGEVMPALTKELMGS